MSIQFNKESGLPERGQHIIFGDSEGKTALPSLINETATHLNLANLNLINARLYNYIDIGRLFSDFHNKVNQPLTIQSNPTFNSITTGQIYGTSIVIGNLVISGNILGTAGSFEYNMTLFDYETRINLPLNCVLYPIHNVGDPELPCDAVNLQTLERYVGTPGSSTSSTPSSADNALLAKIDRYLQAFSKTYIVRDNYGNTINY